MDRLLKTIFTSLVLLLIFLIVKQFTEEKFIEFWAVFFHSPSELPQFFNQYLFSSLLLILLILIYLLFIYPRRNKAFYIGIPISMLLIWGYYRFTRPDIILLPFFGNERMIAYLDTVPIFILLIFITNAFRKREKKKIFSNISYLEADLSPAIEFKGRENDFQDELGREEMAGQIANVIKDINPSKSAFTVGIEGEWGEGKTSFIFQIIRKLSADSVIKDNTIFIWYKPLHSSKEDTLVTHFLETLEGNIRPKNHTLSKEIQSYLRFLRPIGFSFGSISISDIDLFANKTLEDHQKLIETAISNFNKRIVVIIDDMDRLNGKEIQNIFQLIKFIANFKNTIYILAYSKNYISTSIKSFLNESNSEKYIEKFIQVEFKLPPLDPQKLSQFLKNRISDKLKLLKLASYILDVNYCLDNYNITGSLKNIRDVKKFLNSFLIRLSVVHPKVRFNQFFLVELIRFSDPVSYQTIFDHYYLLYEHYFKEHLMKVDKKRQFISSFDKETENPISTFDALFTNQIVRYFLKGIFLEQDHSFGPNSFLNSNSFHLYFSLSDFLTDISEADFENAFSYSQNQFNDKMIEWNSKNRSRVKELINSFNRNADSTNEKRLYRFLFSQLFLYAYNKHQEIEDENWKYAENQNHILLGFRNAYLNCTQKQKEDAIKNVFQTNDFEGRILISFMWELISSGLTNEDAQLYELILDRSYQIASNEIGQLSSLNHHPLDSIKFLSQIVKRHPNSINGEVLIEHFRNKIIHTNRNLFIKSLPLISDYIRGFVPFGKTPRRKLRSEEIKDRIYGIFIDKYEIESLPFSAQKQDMIDIVDGYDDIVFKEPFVQVMPPNKETDSNDYIYNTIFDLEKNNIVVKIEVDTPSTQFWRFGMQFSKDGKFLEQSKRWDINHPLVYLTSGLRDSFGVWQMTNEVMLTSYLPDQFDGKQQSMFDNYSGFGPFNIYINKEAIKILNPGGGVFIFKNDILQEYRFIQFRAWGDGQNFLIHCSIKQKSISNKI